MINANEHGQTLAAFSSKTTVVNWRLQADNDPDARTVAQRVQYATMSLEEASQKWTQELHQTASELNQVSRELELKFAAKKSSSGNDVPDPFKLVRRIHALEIAARQLQEACLDIAEKRKKLSPAVIDQQEENNDVLNHLLRDMHVLEPITDRMERSKLERKLQKQKPFFRQEEAPDEND